MNKKIPMRRCLGCMESKPKKELIRIMDAFHKYNSENMAFQAFGFDKAIIYDAPNIDREKFIIVKNGFYITIYNSSGDLRFSYDFQIFLNDSLYLGMLHAFKPSLIDKKYKSTNFAFKRKEPGRYVTRISM